MKEKTNPKLGRYMDLLSDFTFKKLLGQEENKVLLIDFLNALIDWWRSGGIPTALMWRWGAPA